MRLTVVVPVRDGQHVLADCLSGIAESRRLADEVLVVDDGSCDNSAAIARAHGVKVISHAATISGGPPLSRGPAWARNFGATHATGDILVFVDADVVVHPCALEKMEGRFTAETSLHALFGSYDDKPRVASIPSRFKNLLHHYVHQHSKPAATTFWAGCGAIRRDAFLRIGGFDETYRQPSVEDIELGLRLTRAGGSIQLCPDILSTHLKHWTLWSIVRTDIWSRAVPWTRLVLREGHMPDDLNLSWKSRVSSVCAWGGLAALVACAALFLLGSPAYVGVTSVAAALFLVASTLLNARLHRFYFRQGGLPFAICTWLLHHAYLLYSSATFVLLVLAHAARLTAKREPARTQGSTSPGRP